MEEESLEKGDLTKSTGWDSLLLPFEFDVLDGHEFIIFIHSLIDLTECSFSYRTYLSKSITFLHF